MGYMLFLVSFQEVAVHIRNLKALKKICNEEINLACLAQSLLH